MKHYTNQSVHKPKFRIITRDEWGAIDPLWVKFLQLPIQHVFYEYTYTEECHDMDCCTQALRSLQRYNLNLKDNPDIRYNFLISSDGTVFEGRGWEAAPRLPKKWGLVRRNALYIAFIGAFIDNPPSEEMFQTRSDLVKYGVCQNYILKKHLEYSISTPKVT